MTSCVHTILRWPLSVSVIIVVTLSVVVPWLVVRLVLWAGFGPAAQVDPAALAWILPAGLVAPYAYGGVGVAPSRATLRAFLFDATALAGQAGAGVEFTLRDGLFVGVEAGYAWARPAFSFGTLTLNGFVGQVGLGMRF